MVKIKIGLSTRDINDTIKKLQDFEKSLGTLGNTISEELAIQTGEQIRENYLSSFNPGYEYSNPKGNIKIMKSSNSYKATIVGSGVTYEEFGTGDVGAKHGHPWKGDYQLNPYNSGRTIRSTDKLSNTLKSNLGLKDGLYWTYKDESGKVYTQGIPAGKFMYKSAIWLRNNYKKIIKQKVDDALSKL